MSMLDLIETITQSIIDNNDLNVTVGRAYEIDDSTFGILVISGRLDQLLLNRIAFNLNDYGHATKEVYYTTSRGNPVIIVRLERKP